MIITKPGLHASKTPVRGVYQLLIKPQFSSLQEIVCPFDFSYITPAPS